MLKQILPIVGVGAAIILSACGKSDTGSFHAQGSVASSQADSGKGPGVDVNYSYSQKNEWVAKMKDQLAQVNGEIDKLSAKTKDAADNVKADMQPRIDELKAKAKDLGARIEDTQNANESTWDEVKAKSRSAMDSAKDSFNNARAWAADKIAPKH